MLKSKQDIENAIELHARELAHYDNPECYNAAWCDGYIYAMKEILASWRDLYEGQKLAYATEDAQSHLLEFLSREVFLSDDECDKRVGQAIKDGKISAIAHRFLNDHDCNVAENDQYYSIICNMYYDENQFH